LDQLSEEVNKLYNIDIGKLHGIFENIIKDEERHRETLATIRQILTSKKTSVVDNVPLVKYQNPDSWSRSAPSTTQDAY
jgi:rubrerythrin